ncbi:MAG TPA: polysaccharide deacetylase family protein [Thermoanaerobaculia bacterium]|nr:polysaccharide deacetylase family protein [Thermoanaerobaculia bacterium]
MTARRALSASILILLTIAASAAPKKRVESEGPTATVLCYHIVEAPAAPRMHIDRETFRQHLRYLEMTGYNVVPLRHVYEFVTGKRASLPKNAVVITIDDGWRSTYTEAFPELQKRKFPFTVFIYPNIIGKTANALTWEQIREMAAAGVDIQSHALTHPYLTRRKHRSMSDEAYAAWLRRELAESKRILEKEAGQKVQFLAYPYGDYDDTVAETAKKVGYTAALTCDFGRVKKGSDPLKMKRFVIDDKMDFAAFRKYLGATPMLLAEMTPKPGKIDDPAITTISAKIPKFESLDPKSVGMALLSLGSAIPYSYDARSGEVRLTLSNALANLKSKVHRAVVWGTDLQTGKRVEATWVFRMPDPNAPPAPAPATTAPVVAAAAPKPKGPGDDVEKKVLEITWNGASK